MATCGHCGTTIVFGGKKHAGLRYCNEKCREQGVLNNAAGEVPEEIVIQHALKVHAGKCPKCGGPGPVDVHTSHTVWSAVFMTQWKSKPQVCCRKCGRNAKLGDTLFCAGMGWWGFPWGIILTPIQLLRNVGGLLVSPNPAEPSANLIHFVRLTAAAEYADSQRRRRYQAVSTDDSSAGGSSAQPVREPTIAAESPVASANPTKLIRCRFCDARIVPKEDGVCPACQAPLI
jgi:hypothetical protein